MNTGSSLAIRRPLIKISLRIAKAYRYHLPYKRMRLPNFLIIGATKAGTTSLHHYLGQHPDIFVAPTKETNFFAQESALCFTGRTVSLPEEYAAQFAAATTQKAIGESSPAYLAVPLAPERIARMLPHAKLIVILRNPI